MRGEGLVHCVRCAHFSYFPTEKGHNSPHALGKCGEDSWDGNKGQWAYFFHPCTRFEERADKPQALAES
jgi:hypothetical protein